MFQALSQTERTALELELVPAQARLGLTRLIRAAVRGDDQDGDRELERMNTIVNIARAVQNLGVYVLQSDDWGHYSPAEYAYHRGELELVFRRPSTPDLADVIGDLIADGCLECDNVNQVLAGSGVSFSYSQQSSGDTRCWVSPVADLPEPNMDDEHPNIRALFDRANRAVDDRDLPAVVHACGSVLETLAKDVVGRQSVQDRSLGSFFDAFQKRSNVPAEVLLFAKEIFDRRNTTPLAGHGSLKLPQVTQAEAVAVLEFTRAIVRVERQLAQPQIGSPSSEIKGAS